MLKLPSRPVLLLAAAALAAGGLGGCSRSEPEVAEEANAAIEQPVPDAAPPSPVAPPSPASAPTADANSSAALPPAAETAPDEQMLEDASATGMTARASRDEADAAETAPADTDARQSED